MTFAAGVGQLVGSRSVVNERSRSLIASWPTFENVMLSPIVGVLLRVTSATLIAAPGALPSTSAIPAMSPALGPLIRYRLTCVGVPAAVTVPVPTWHDEFGVDDSRHAPPAWSAFASSPLGRANVMSLGKSPVLDVNVVSKPTVAGLVPAVVLGSVSVSAGAIDADATAGSASTALAITAPTRALHARSDTWQIPPLMTSV